MTNAPLDAALAALRARGPEMLALTRSWVEINSYTSNVAGVNAVGALLQQAFALPSLSCTVLPGGTTVSTGGASAPAPAATAPANSASATPLAGSAGATTANAAAAEFGDHLIWRTPAALAPGASPILLIGHHDTVFPPGHFEGWREEGGRAIGPGALDMKGGLSVIRTALAALDDVGLLATLPIAVISVADEEIGSPSSSPHLVALARGASCALVFESGRAADAIITRRRGVGAMTVIAHGKAAHAGNNHKDGANAIWALAKFIDAVQQLTDYPRGCTVNVGQITGGTSKNTVPERAECMLDLRYETVGDAEQLVAAIRAAAATAASAVPGVRLDVTGGARRLPLERTPASAALRDEYAAHARAENLGDGEAPLLGGGSDANTVAPLGVPAIDGLGPRGAGFHTTTEYVELATFAPKAAALLRFLHGRGTVHT